MAYKPGPWERIKYVNQSEAIVKLTIGTFLLKKIDGNWIVVCRIK